MLNRYGLFDIEKFLREQDEPPPPPEGADQQSPPEGGGGTPDEKIEKQRNQDRTDGIVDFRRKHADAIYRLVQAYRRYRKAGETNQYPDPSVDERYDFNSQNRNLKSKFETSGVDTPYMAVFDQESTGLDGDMHVRFLTAIHGGRAGGGGRFMFPSPGEAAEFVDAAGQLQPDLAFTQQRGDPRVVTYTEQPEQEEQPDQQTQQMQQQMQQQQAQPPQQPPVQ